MEIGQSSLPLHPPLTAIAGERPLAGKVAIVTGASSGIGRAVAVALAQAGARVGLLGRRRQLLEQVAEEMHRVEGEGWLLVTDVTDRRAVEQAIARSVKLGGGRLDILVNNAGINTKQRSLATVSAEDWERVIAVNLTGAYWCTRAVLPVMRQQGQGHIINISSTAGQAPDIIAGVAYSASKAGLDSLSASINIEERRYGIRACVIRPGEVDTPILAHRPVVPSVQARGTMMQPEDVARTVLFVATLPRRVAVEELTVQPTVLRDMSSEIEPS